MTLDTAALRARLARIKYKIRANVRPDTADVGWLADTLGDAAVEVERTLEYVRNADQRVIEADQRTDASRTAHADLVAELRTYAALGERGITAYELRTLLVRHAPEVTTNNCSRCGARPGEPCTPVPALLDRHAPKTDDGAAAASSAATAPAEPLPAPSSDRPALDRIAVQCHHCGKPFTLDGAKEHLAEHGLSSVRITPLPEKRDTSNDCAHMAGSCDGHGDF